MNRDLPESPNAVPFSCLLVDDDVGFAGILSKLIGAAGGKAVLCQTIASAQTEIGQRSFDLIVLDNRLPDGSGHDFYSQVVRKSPASIVVMITGAPELSQAIELTRNGLFDYLTKPVNADDFEAMLGRAKLRLSKPAVEPGLEGFSGNSPQMQAVLRDLQQVAQHADATVLLLGETGTGKDLAARLLHSLTHGKKAPQIPYVALNCPNVPAEMFEAELFGSEKGAYTGADRRRTGLVEAAEGGTLFLDEIAEIPLGLQAKLLRFLESREYRSLGATEMRRFNGRVVAATNRCLEEEVRKGRFREDLMYRLDVFGVRLLPLREHISDVGSIAEALLTQLCQRYDRTKPMLRPQDLEALGHYHFPGNVRELRNLLERSLLRSSPATSSLVLDLAWLKRRSEATPSTPAQTDIADIHSVPRALTPLEAQEYRLIAETLNANRGGIRRSAARLGLTPQALLRRLQKWPELRPKTCPSEAGG